MDLNLEAAFDEPVDLSHEFESRADISSGQSFSRCRPVSFTGRLERAELGFLLTGRLDSPASSHAPAASRPCRSSGRTRPPGSSCPRTRSRSRSPSPPRSRPTEGARDRKAAKGAEKTGRRGRRALGGGSRRRLLRRSRRPVRPPHRGAAPARAPDEGALPRRLPGPLPAVRGRPQRSPRAPARRPRTGAGASLKTLLQHDDKN